MKKYLFLTLVFVHALSFSQERTEKEAAIVYLLELINVKSQAAQVFDLLIPQFQKLAPSVPGEFWELFRKNIDFNDFIEELVPLYDRYYTLEEITLITAFYESPAGKKMIEVTPLMTAESMKAGERWGKKMVERLLDALRVQGHTL
jgi:D-alanyl-lipoteichoic acid acyltransferase DltB (MBOAT superfamily)